MQGIKESAAISASSEIVPSKSECEEKDYNHRVLNKNKNMQFELSLCEYENIYLFKTCVFIWPLNLGISWAQIEI